MDENGEGGPGESGESRRPNPGWRLSRPDGNPDEITYHYDRERRLRKAPDAVRELYHPTEKPRRMGPFRIGPGSRMQLATMLVVLIVSGVALFITITNKDEGTYDLRGNRVTVQAIRLPEEGMVIVAIAKTIPKSSPLWNRRPTGVPYFGTVGIEVSPFLPAEAAIGEPAPQGDPEETFFLRVNFTEANPEFFRFTVPFESQALKLVFRAAELQLAVNVAVE